MNKPWSLFLLLLWIASCTEDRTTISVPAPSYNQAYNYFPSQDGYEWTYIVIIEDGQGTTLSESTETGIYKAATNSIVSSVNGSLIGTSNWYNSGSRLLCCNGSVLLDYTELDCAEDSTLIREETTVSNKTFIQTYQHCNTKQMGFEGYENTKSIKTFQHNTFRDGSQLLIDRHFGFGIGLLYEKQTSINVQGEVNRVETKQLKSHQF
jgi:hypothetical protein